MSNTCRSSTSSYKSDEKETPSPDERAWNPLDNHVDSEQGHLSKEGDGDHETAPTSPIPNGGLVAWLQVVAGFFCFMNAWGLVNAFGVFQDYYSTTLIPDVSNSNISWIGSIQAFLLCSATVVAGPIYDRGHPRVLVVFGSFMTVFGMMMTSLCHEYWQLILAQGICAGIGAGCLFLTAIAIVPSYFTTKKAVAMGFAASGSSLGGVIYPIVFHRVEPQVGFGWATRIIAFISLATLLIPCIFIKARAFPTTQRKLIDLAAFKELPYTLFCLASFVGFIGLYVPFFYVSEFASVKAGLDPTMAFYMLPITSAGSVAGRIIPGLVADRLGVLNVLGSFTVVAGLLGFCWIAIHHAAGGLIVWSLLYGAFSGSFVSLQPTTVVCLTKDLSTVGGRMGLNTFCASLGILIGTPIAGVLVGNQNWVGMQVFCGATLLASALLVVATRVAFAGYGLKDRV